MPSPTNDEDDFIISDSIDDATVNESEVGAETTTDENIDWNEMTVVDDVEEAKKVSPKEVVSSPPKKNVQKKAKQLKPEQKLAVGMALARAAKLPPKKPAKQLVESKRKSSESTKKDRRERSNSKDSDRLVVTDQGRVVEAKVIAEEQRRVAREKASKERAAQRAKDKAAAVASAAKRKAAEAEKRRKAEEQRKKRAAEKAKVLDEMAPPKKLLEPLPGVETYVKGLRDAEKVTSISCFYCAPCHVFLASQEKWNEHTSMEEHKKAAIVWKSCATLQEKLSEDTKIAGPIQDAIDDDSTPMILSGADHLILLFEPPSAGRRSTIKSKTVSPKQAVCTLCYSALDGSVDAIVSHLRDFHHIDNHMERLNPNLYVPPGRSIEKKNNVRSANDVTQNLVLAAASTYVESNGRGEVKVFLSEDVEDGFIDVDPSSEKFKSLAVQLDTECKEVVEKCLKDDAELPYTVIDKKRCVANADYDKTKTGECSHVLGLQYLVEVWSASRRSLPAYYCSMCHCITTDFVEHCTTPKHQLDYMHRHYTDIYVRLLLDSSNEESLNNNLITAVKQSLEREGRLARLHCVVQLSVQDDMSFVVFNKAVVKKIVEKLNFAPGDPPIKPPKVVSKTPSKAGSSSSKKAHVSTSSRAVKSSSSRVSTSKKSGGSKSEVTPKPKLPVKKPSSTLVQARRRLVEKHVSVKAKRPPPPAVKVDRRPKTAVPLLPRPRPVAARPPKVAARPAPIHSAARPTDYRGYVTTGSSSIKHNSDHVRRLKSNSERVLALRRAREARQRAPVVERYPKQPPAPVNRRQPLFPPPKPQQQQQQHRFREPPAPVQLAPPLLDVRTAPPPMAKRGPRTPPPPRQLSSPRSSHRQLSQHQSHHPASHSVDVARHAHSHQQQPPSRHTPSTHSSHGSSRREERKRTYEEAQRSSSSSKQQHAKQIQASSHRVAAAASKPIALRDVDHSFSHRAASAAHMPAPRIRPLPEPAINQRRSRKSPSPPPRKQRRPASPPRRKEEPRRHHEEEQHHGGSRRSSDHHHQSERRSGGSEEGRGFRFEGRYFSAQDLERLRSALSSVGVQLGRTLTKEDLTLLKTRLGPQVVLQLLDRISRGNISSSNGSSSVPQSSSHSSRRQQASSQSASAAAAEFDYVDKRPDNRTSSGRRRQPQSPPPREHHRQQRKSSPDNQPFYPDQQQGGSHGMNVFSGMQFPPPVMPQQRSGTALYPPQQPGAQAAVTALLSNPGLAHMLFNAQPAPPPQQQMWNFLNR